MSKTQIQENYYTLGKKSIYFPSILKEEDLFLTTYMSPIKVLLQNQVNKMVEFRTKNVSTKTILSTGVNSKNIQEVEQGPITKRIKPTPKMRKKIYSGSNNLEEFLKIKNENNILKEKDYNHFLKIKYEGTVKKTRNFKKKDDSFLMKINFTKSTVNSVSLDVSTISYNHNEVKNLSPLAFNKNQKSAQTVNMNKFYKNYTIHKSQDFRNSGTSMFNTSRVKKLNIQFKNIKNNKELQNSEKKERTDKTLFLEFLNIKDNNLNNKNRVKSSSKMVQTK